MATRYIQKVGALADLLNLPTAGGIGIYGGKVYMNLNGNVSAIANAPAFGNTLLVDGDHGSATDTRLPYSTIQLAVAAASHGDTILIRALDSDSAGIAAGTADDPPGYVGDITVAVGQENLSLVGVGGGCSQISQPCIRKGATTTSPLLTIKAVGVSVQNLTFNGAGATGGGIALDAVASVSDAAGFVADGCHFKNCKGATTSAGARRGGVTILGGGCWYSTIQNCDFYSCRNGIISVSTSLSIPKDLKILGCRFYGAKADVDCDIDLMAGGDGVNGLVIDGCVFGVVDVPAYATGTGYKSRYLDLTGCINGILSNSTFACLSDTTGSEVTFKLDGTAALIPATVRIAGCYGEGIATSSHLSIIGRSA
jgi:hypothetical protein